MKMAEGGAGSAMVASRNMTGSPQMFTDWDGLMDDLFHNKGRQAGCVSLQWCGHVFVI